MGIIKYVTIAFVGGTRSGMGARNVVLRRSGRWDVWGIIVCGGWLRFSKCLSTVEK